MLLLSLLIPRCLRLKVHKPFNKRFFGLKFSGLCIPVYFGSFVLALVSVRYLSPPSPSVLCEMVEFRQSLLPPTSVFCFPCYDGFVTFAGDVAQHL